MASEESYESTPRQCVNGCGFFGCPETQNLCSKCYRDFLLEEAKKQSSAAVAKLGAEKISGSSSSTDSAAAATSSFEDMKLKLNNGKAKDRCDCCNKKVGLVKGFKCRCGNLYCSAHRYPEEHKCSFDFKSAGRNLLAKSNPVVQADKLLERI